jgi:hypothetical protein
MADSRSDSVSNEAPTLSPAGLPGAFAWLDKPRPLNAADELTPLRGLLSALRASQVAPEQRAAALDHLYTRSMSVVTTLLPSLATVSFPVPRKTRQLIRGLQDLLATVAEDLLATLDDIDVLLIRGLRQETNFLDLTLQKSLHALAQHLLISDLAASPASIGIWQQLHQTYDTACRLNLASDMPDGAAKPLQKTYYSAILLGCAQPASFSSREVNFVAAYLERFPDWIDSTSAKAAPTPAMFWIDPARDAPAVACSRKAPPPDAPVRFFSCDRLAALLKEQLAALEAGGDAQQLGLPDFAGTTAGRGVLRRLITYWGEPGKRRFPRRRQNYRAALCAGLGNLWTLFQEGDAALVETSSWMVTNESPDGYAVMHVSGKTGSMSVGDVTAIRTESSEDWQICIVRWALSENQEHLEFGLQILATHAVPAFLAVPADADDNGRLSVLILPEIPALRSTEMLVVPSGALGNQRKNFILVVEKDNLEVREVRSTRLDEQNSQIEVFSIEPDTSSPF